MLDNAFAEVGVAMAVGSVSDISPRPKPGPDPDPDPEPDPAPYPDPDGFWSRAEVQAAWEVERWKRDERTRFVAHMQVCSHLEPGVCVGLQAACFVATPRMRPGHDVTRRALSYDELAAKALPGDRSRAWAACKVCW